MPLLTPTQAADVVDRLMKRSDSWIHMDRRAGPLPSFIMGAYYQYLSFDTPFPTPRQVNEAREARAGSSALPAGKLATSTLTYSQVVQQYRTILLGEFGDLYSAIRKGLQEVTGQRVEYDANWGVPGFQITLSHRVFEWHVFQAHIDGAWSPLLRDLQARGETCAPSARLSFTVPLQMPRNGGGLEYYLHDEAKCAAADIGPEMSGVSQCLSGPHHEEYRPGEMVVHAGSTIHAVRPWRYGKGMPDDARISIQGFAFYCDGRWVVHW